MSKKPKDARRKVTLDYCKGTNSGAAIYLQCDEPDGSGGGFRVAGPKCWGFVEPVASFEMSLDDLNCLMREAKAAIRFLRIKAQTE